MIRVRRQRQSAHSSYDVYVVCRHWLWGIFFCKFVFLGVGPIVSPHESTLIETALEVSPPACVVTDRVNGKAAYTGRVCLSANLRRSH